MPKELLTVRCPDDLAQLIQEQIETTGLDKTTVVVGMLRQSFPCVSFKDRGKLPPIPAIYLVFSSNNLLYVGRSSNLRQRWQSHHRHHQFKLIEGLQIAWFECHADNLPVVESTLIDLLDPEYNGTYNEWSNEKSKVISFRLEDDLVEKLKQKALPGETPHQTAQRLTREALDMSVPSIEAAPAVTVDLDERIESIVEERFASFVGNQNDLLNRLQARLQEVESQLGKSQAWLSQRSTR